MCYRNVTEVTDVPISNCAIVQKYFGFTSVQILFNCLSKAKNLLIEESIVQFNICDLCIIVRTYIQYFNRSLGNI